MIEKTTTTTTMIQPIEEPIQIKTTSIEGVLDLSLSR